MTQEDKVVEKIKKLLELSSSPNEHEAQLAMDRAQDMLARYSINLSDHETKPEQIVEESYEWSGRIPQNNLHYIVSIVARIFSCEALKRMTAIKIVGMPTNIKVAHHAIDCILNQLRLDYEQEKSHYRSIAFFHSFWSGAVAGIQEKFTKQESKGTGLVVYDKVQAYLKTLHCGISKSLSNESDGYNAGITAGKQAEIRAGVNPQVQGNLLR